MKNRRIPLFLLLLIMATLAGCGFIEAVFKTGVGVGVFIVVALLLVILAISRRKRGV